MRQTTRIGFAVVASVMTLAVGPSTSWGQMSDGTDVNVSVMANYQNECSIVKNPSNKLQLFMACNNPTGGLFAARSTDGGATWTYPDADKTIADGDENQGNRACCDPTLAWDTFGNLYVGYLGNTAASVEILLSTDAGQTFTQLATFAGSVDQPTIVADTTSAPGAPVALWAVWNQSGSMRASGAAVTGLNTVGAFNTPQIIPGTNNCSFGDVAIAPNGTVVNVCQTIFPFQGPSTLRVNIDADGLGPNNFAAAAATIATNVGSFDVIPPQARRSIDAEAGLAFDRFATSPRNGRLYMVYTEETTNENNDTDIMVRFSDDNGATWSAATQVNDDTTPRSQFLPRISTNRLSGNVGVCWHDARNAPANDRMQVYCTLSTPTPATPTFLANGRVSDGFSTGEGSNPPGAGLADIQFGDYAGMDYHQGVLHPAWADDANGTTRYEAFTDRVSGGAAANEGDPHMTTVNGVRYDFQSAGEFVSLRGDGTEIQIRQSPVATTFFPGPNAHTGLRTCASLNTAVAARVGTHRVTFQPNLSGVPDPEGMQLRIDGSLIQPTDAGVNFADGGRVARAPVGDGVVVDLPNGTRLVATSHWWSSQQKWFLNVNAYSTPATEGTMGVIAAPNWLPALPDGSPMGPRPVDLDDRYDELYGKFTAAWRVTSKNTLFDYAPGKSTDDFTFKDWPKREPPCELPEQPEPAKGIDIKEAQQLCAVVAGKQRRESCAFDVATLGEPGFVEAYLVVEKLEAGLTQVLLSDDIDPSQPGQSVTFTAAVSRTVPGDDVEPLQGLVTFFINEEPMSEAELDAFGRARWKTAQLPPGQYEVTARYAPQSGTVYSSRSAVQMHQVGGVKK